MANFRAAATEPLLDMWFDMAKEDGITIDQWTAAARQILRARKFTSQPTYADFHEAIHGDLTNKANNATVQVSIIMKQIRDIGSYRTPVYDDPITKQLMTSRWSWPSVCAMTEDEHKWWAKEFIEAYQATEKLEPQTAIDGNGSSRLRLLAGGIGKRG